jgi:hypothetical protein
LKKNRLLVLAVAFIIVGAIGLFIVNRLGGPLVFGHGMSFGNMPMGMMGKTGMMRHDQMRGMMQEMMSGILPPGLKPEDLPDPESPGAKLTTTFCTQCHNLPSPRMQSAEDWPRVAGRMIARERMMEGRPGMMGIKAPYHWKNNILTGHLMQTKGRPKKNYLLFPIL